MITSLNPIQTTVQNNYISHLKSLNYDQAYNYLNQLCILVNSNTKNKVLVPWLICATIGHGKHAAIQIMTYIDFVFGKEYFFSPIFITLAAYMGNLNIVKFLWARYETLPQKFTIEMAMKRGHFDVVEYMMMEHMFPPTITLDMKLAQEMFNEFLV
jgi:hypothetical protein